MKRKEMKEKTINQKYVSTFRLVVYVKKKKSIIET